MFGLITLLLSLAGCGDTDDPGRCGDSGQDTGVQVGVIDAGCRCAEAELDIGTGERAFAPMEDGDDLVMVNGPQGGWHLLTAIKVLNTRDVVTILANVFHDETDTPVSQDMLYRVALVDDPEACQGSFPNMYLFLDSSAMGEATPPELLACETLRIEMQLTDTGGRSLLVTQLVRAVPDPANVESGLAEACE